MRIAFIGYGEAARAKSAKDRFAVLNEKTGLNERKG